MLKLDMEKATKEMIASGVIGGFLLLAALIATFRAFPEHPWPGIFAILYIAHLGSFQLALQELRANVRTRAEWTETLAQQFALLAIHRGEHENYENDYAFWTAMREAARDDIGHADGMQNAGADIFGERKPRAIWSLVGSVVSLVCTVALAWFIASL